MRLISALVMMGWLPGCGAGGAAAPASAPTSEQAARAAPDSASAAAASPPAAASAVQAAPPAKATSAAATPLPTSDTRATPTFAEAEPRLRAAGFPMLADILSVRVTQTRRKMKLTDDEAARTALALIDELPVMPRTRTLLELMPKASIELVRSIRERGVSRDEAERMAEFLLEVRTSLAMDNPTPFDENCSHVVGREWQDIDYRDEGMTWQKQQAIYAPRGVPDFKSVANLRQFFRIESKAPYFQKLYQVKGSAP